MQFAIQENANGDLDSAAFKVVDVNVNDSFWGPGLARWESVTVNDVFDKFEGKYKPDGTTLERDFKVMGETRNAFKNFDLVAEGKRNIVLLAIDRLAARRSDAPQRR